MRPNWEPVRDGRFFCSPACGGQCEFDWYEQAQRRGAALAALLGDGWQATVWENLGWHYRATSPCGRVKVHVHRGEVPVYTAFLGDFGSAGGRWARSDCDPREAVRQVVEAGRRDLAAIGAVFSSLSYFEEEVPTVNNKIRLWKRSGEDQQSPSDPLLWEVSVGDDSPIATVKLFLCVPLEEPGPVLAPEPDHRGLSWDEALELVALALVAPAALYSQRRFLEPPGDGWDLVLEIHPVGIGEFSVLTPERLWTRLQVGEALAQFVCLTFPTQWRGFASEPKAAPLEAPNPELRRSQRLLAAVSGRLERQPDAFRGAVAELLERLRGGESVSAREAADSLWAAAFPANGGSQ